MEKNITLGIILDFLQYQYNFVDMEPVVLDIDIYEECKFIKTYLYNCRIFDESTEKKTSIVYFNGFFICLEFKI